ncbi:transaldolase [Geomonas sp. RF6]|uniref:transaldolase n=1 Tax=Geomonas sp. RF6 TaxID=2897342 RepID=UPI001E4BF59E|nr:transaldolase [Geomonas sp. RF6]UFS70793.1 transaldolase [Geomonas sp. RF6]
MKDNPLSRLRTFGQSVWLDYLHRDLLDSGELARLIEEDGLGGVTSNPAIFEKAIGESSTYDAAIVELAQEGRDAGDIYEALAVQDIRRTADLFRPLYDSLKGADGFVSLEVSPHLAYDSVGTVAEARRLWESVARPNVLIKVPGTRQGLDAIRQLVSEGININVTLLFGLPRYREVTEAFIAGLETRRSRGQHLEVSSVASFFLSRIDVLVDQALERKIAEGGDRAETAAMLQGQTAIACAKMAYQIFREAFHSDRFRELASAGARPQRVLWASTGTKNPAYSDVKYVEPLVGADTVNTMPMETLVAYRDHGNPAPLLEEGMDDARAVLDRLPQVGINLDSVTAQLEEEGVVKFVQPFDKLMRTIDKKGVPASAQG